MKNMKIIIKTSVALLCLSLAVSEAMATPFRGERDPALMTAIITLLLLDDSPPVNRAPVARDDEASGTVGVTVSLSTLDNDTDDGSLDVSSVKLVDMAATDEDVDGDNDKLIVAGEGIWTVSNTTGEISFAPGAGFTDDPAPIRYTVNDTLGLESNQASVSVNYLQGAAPLAHDDSRIATIGSMGTIDTLANDTDADNDIDPATVTLTAAGATDEDQDGDADKLIVPTEGIWVVNNSNGEISFMPDAGFISDPTPVRYIVRDATGDRSNEAIVSFQYTPATAPQAEAGAGAIIYSGQVTLNGSASSDVNEDTLSYAWSLISRPAGSNAGLSDPTLVNPVFTADMAGRYEFSLTVNDGFQDSQADTVVYVYLPCVFEPQHFQLAAANVPATGAPAADYFPGTAGFLGEALGIEAVSAGNSEAIFIDLDGNAFGDLVLRRPGSTQIEVWLSNASGTLQAPVAYSFASAPLTAIAAGNLIVGGLPDIVVADQDGRLAFFEGTGAGIFAHQRGFDLARGSEIIRLEVADFTGDGQHALLLSTADAVSIYTHDNQVVRSPLIRNGGFEQQLSFWMSEAVGHATNQLSGEIQSSNGTLVLSENASFRTSLKQNFVIPPSALSLSFDLLSVALDDPQGGIADAFEVSLLNASNFSVVPTITADATAFLNINPDDPGANTLLASGVSRTGNRYTLDISGIAAGTPVTLYFDLIGNPPGEGAHVVIDNIDAGIVTAPLTDLDHFALSGPFGSVIGIGSCDTNGDQQTDIIIRDDGNDELLIYSPDQAGGYGHDRSIPLNGL